MEFSLIFNLVLNAFTSFTAIVFNTFTIHAMSKTSSLPGPFKTLLLSLAVSDLIAGLLAQPFYILLIAIWSKQKNTDDTLASTLLLVTICALCTASLLNVMALNIDRFLAVHLHLRYQELVTHKRVVAVVISIWVFSTFVSLMVVWASVSIHNIVISVTGTVGFILTTVVYIKIYLTIRRHKNQIQSLQVQEVNRSGETSYVALIKSTIGVFYVYLVFLACYLPYVISVVIVRISNADIALKKLTLFSMTFIFLNSSLNPVIYFSKMRHIRRAIMEILWSLSWSRNRASR